MPLLDQFLRILEQENNRLVTDNVPQSPAPLAATSVFTESQDDIYARYATSQVNSTTKFNKESKAYRFTNEPLGDLRTVQIQVDEPALVVTASGDASCLLAGMGVRQIYGVDVSTYANAWGEYKWQAFLQLKYDDFKKKIASSLASWTTFPFDIDVSQQAKSLAQPFRNKDKKLIDTTDFFWNQSYAGSNYRYTGYLDDKATYEQLQQRAQGAAMRLYPGDFCTFFERKSIPSQYFGTIYVSNVFDHIIDPLSEKLMLEENALTPLVSTLLGHLQPKGSLLVNLQWNDRAKAGLTAALATQNFSLEQLAKKYGGCGSMYVARRKKEN